MDWGLIIFKTQWAIGCPPPDRGGCGVDEGHQDDEKARETAREETRFNRGGYAISGMREAEKTSSGTSGKPLQVESLGPAPDLNGADN